MTKKTISKAGTKVMEFDVVGMKYHLTASSRKYLARYVEKIRVEQGGLKVELRREPENQHDENAIAVWVAPENKIELKGMMLGYVPRQVAEVLAPKLDASEISFRAVRLTDIDAEEGNGQLQAICVKKKVS
jgi:hypothetical protein